jgi:hypothetical protein
VSLPEASKPVLLRLRETGSAEELVFHTSNGTPYNDSNLLHRDLKPAGRKLGLPWLSWHPLRRTHATLFQFAGGSLRDAQAQLGHSKMSTTLEIYTLPLPEQQRATVEKLSVLMANDGRNRQNPEDCRSPRSRFNEINGRHVGTGTPDSLPCQIFAREEAERVRVSLSDRDR